MPAQERQEPDLLTRSAEASLADGPITILGLLPYSSNQTLLVRCGDDDGPLAVYKPRSGERPLWDFPDGTLYLREVAAYELSAWLGWDIVPLTVVRDDAPLGVGSVQLFVEHDPEQHYFTLLGDHQAQLRRMAFFDILANNADRKSGHVLRDNDGRLWFVDHGLTFHAEPKLRTIAWEFAGEPLPAPERRSAGRLAQALADPASALSDRMGQFLGATEVRALELRAEALCQPGEFPAPESGWSFPWPLV